MFKSVFTWLNSQRRKEYGTCLVVLGTDSGEVFTINANNGELKWKSSGHHNGYAIIIIFLGQLQFSIHYSVEVKNRLVVNGSNGVLFYWSKWVSLRGPEMIFWIFDCLLWLQYLLYFNINILFQILIAMI